MKTFLNALLSSLLILMVNVVHAQTASVVEGCAPLEVSFTTPGGLANHFWDFKDGATSTLMNPTNTFISDGVFVAELYEGQGGALIGTVTITVYPKPILDLVATPTSGCEPLTVVFEENVTVASGITISNFQWVFGDGSLANGDPVSHTYVNDGSYTVGLNIETNFPSCNITEVFDDLITVAPTPNANFITSPNPASACEGPFEVSFTNLTPNPETFTFTWDFGNGQTSTLANPPSQTYGDGDYVVTMTASDGSACSRTLTRNVSVSAPTASFQVADTICLGQSTMLTNQSSFGFYIWNFGPDADPPISSQANPSVTFESPGFHDITLTVAAGPCNNDTTITVFVEDPQATIIADPSYTCNGVLTTQYSFDAPFDIEFEWVFSDGSTSTDPNPTHTVSSYLLDSFSVNDQVLFPVFLNITNPSGCMATITHFDTIHRPNSLFRTDLVDGCVPLEVEFRDTSSSNEDIVDWEWHYGNGTVENRSDGEPFTYTYTMEGDFESYLIITNSAGCKDTSYHILIEVGDNILPDFTVDQTEVCPGDTIRFSDITNDPRIDTWHFETEGGRSFHCYNTSEMDWVFESETGAQDATLTVGFNGCFTSATKDDLILVKGPIAELNYRMECDSPYDFIFADSSYDATSVTWEFGDSTMSTIPDLTHTYDTTGNYMVVLTAENPGSGCPASSDTAMVFVRAIDAQFELDSVICFGSTQLLDASTSVDVYNDCWRGFTWYMSFNRPITTHEAAIPQIFGDSGMHNVMLVTTDINGCTDSLIQEVEVYATRPAFMADDANICFPATINFTDLSTADTTIVGWNWNFGDNETSTDQNPTHVYPASLIGLDTFRVELQTTDIFGCQYVTAQRYDVYRPESTIAATPANICVGDEIFFSATDFTDQGSSLMFDWDFGNTLTGDAIRDTVVYNQEGTYEVQLIFEEIASGCFDTTETFVNVQAYPIADFATSVDGQSVVCYPENIIFSDNSTSSTPLTYDWDFGNGQMAQEAGPASIFGKGMFEVTLITSTSFGCRDTIMESLTLVGPEGDFLADRNQICRGESITFNLIDTLDISSWSWDFGDGTGIDDVDPVTHEFDALVTGQTVVKLVLKGQDDACTFGVEQPITIFDIRADFNVTDGVDTTFCTGTVFFENQSTNADAFNWNIGGLGTSIENSPEFVFDEAGIYTISLEVENLAQGCKDSVSQIIEINPSPLVEVFSDTICEGDEVTLNTSIMATNASFSWMPVNLLDDPSVENPMTLPITENTDFELLVTDENDCQTSAVGTIFVIEPPEPMNAFDTTVFLGDMFTLPLNYQSGLYNYQWNIEDGLDCTDCSNPTGFVPEGLDSINYILTVSDLEGCSTVFYEYTVYAFDKDVDFPNIFTPNGDGTSDYFNYVLDGEGDAALTEILDFKIYNRWGTIVYDNDDPVNGWDGTHDGKAVPSDTYIYVLKVRYLGTEPETETGDVTLVR